MCTDLQRGGSWREIFCPETGAFVVYVYVRGKKNSNIMILNGITVKFHISNGAGKNAEDYVIGVLRVKHSLFRVIVMVPLFDEGEGCRWRAMI